MTMTKPYRPNVGIALFNAAGQVLIGRRFRDDGPEIILPGLEWQMPQGGIDADENPRDAVMRECGKRPAWRTRPISVKPIGFFFQAEDGIRDYKVTGVQTCALPI